MSVSFVLTLGLAILVVVALAKTAQVVPQRAAISPSAIGLIFGAWPAQPNAASVTACR